MKERAGSFPDRSRIAGSGDVEQGEQEQAGRAHRGAQRPASLQGERAFAAGGRCAGGDPGREANRRREILRTGRTVNPNGLKCRQKALPRVFFGIHLTVWF